MKHTRSTLLGLAIVSLFVPNLLFGQAKYPKDPIRLVITHAAGGTTDMAARLIQPYLQKYLGVPVVIENMQGAGGNVARSFVFKQPADGYTLLVSQQPSMSSGQIVSGGKFDVLKFVHVFNIAGRNYDCVAVGPNSPFKSIEDLKKASAAQALTSAGTGVGSNAYILAMLLKSKAGVNISYVPFNSGTEAALALAGNQTQMGTGALDSYAPLHEQKRLRVLAVSGPHRDESHREFPTLSELGYDIKMDQMTGVFAPPGLPDAQLKILVAAFQKAFADKDYLGAAATAKQTLQPMPPAEFYKASEGMYKTIQSLESVLKHGK
ncbi:MAG: Bug family tripartite tricarboxylate transporter substrate binding protein [Chloroflexota bacterium]